MTKSIPILVLLIFFFAISNAQAVTVRNKCSFPVAGSLVYVSTGVPLYQFRLVPDEKVHMKRIPQGSLQLNVIPDIRNLKLIKLQSLKFDSPDCYIEIYVKKGKLKIKIN
jgi:hypothetical protein